MWTAKGRCDLLSAGLYSVMTGARTAKMLVEAKFVNWVSVDSSVFTSAAYHCDKRQLFLRFHSGKIYRYSEFPPGGYDELLAAESKGEYFAGNIRGKFFYEEVRHAHGSAG